MIGFKIRPTSKVNERRLILFTGRFDQSVHRFLQITVRADLAEVNKVYF